VDEILNQDGDVRCHALGAIRLARPNLNITGTSHSSKNGKNKAGNSKIARISMDHSRYSAENYFSLDEILNQDGDVRCQGP
jgi:hypothetical protein